MITFYAFIYCKKKFACALILCESVYVTYPMQNLQLNTHPNDIDLKIFRMRELLSHYMHSFTAMKKIFARALILCESVYVTYPMQNL